MTKRMSLPQSRITSPASIRIARPVWAAWASRPAEMIAVAVSVAALVIAATWIGQPELRVRAASSDALRYLSGFWDIERNDAGSFRWSQTDATIRLFGLEQQA